ncbi:MAG: type II toxin-antitoxin system prevent-host-death family antitoxin [Thermoleophilia bacterium]|nr:type II toxin-antitoxin system prevent-host-death family antitoxin [Thermoleophilia bacterium]
MFEPRPAAPVPVDNVRPIRGSRTATVRIVPTIPQKDLRNKVGEILRRAEAGEEFTITVSGRPAAQLGPIRDPHWVDSGQLSAIWELPVDPTLAQDLEAFGGELRDPWAA